MKYTDNTPIPFGKHKFTALCRVPADYLLRIYENNSLNNDLELKTYLEENIESIILRNEGSIESPPLNPVCYKRAYITEKDAKYVLSKISEKIQFHKKPVRAYECDKCGYWHLTSIPMAEWRIKQRFSEFRNK